MQTPQIVVTKVAQDNRIDSTGKSVADLVITFTVDGHGPFTERIDKASFNPATLQQQLTDFAAKIRQLPIAT